MDPLPILPSSSDLERRRLESTIDNDLGSLSLSSLPTSTTSHSNSFLSSNQSTMSMEYPRAETMSISSQPYHQFNGPSETPRATRIPSTVGRMSSFGAGQGEQSMFVGASPVSTAGHHASAVTLGAGVFGKDDYFDTGSEFDPERSLGRLVGELGRVMGSDKLPSRPSSPFSPPRSPSPLTSTNQPGNLSFTLNRNDPLLSPPSSGGEQTITQKDYQQRTNGNTNSRFSSLARELGEDLRKARQVVPPTTRRALSDSTTHNIIKVLAPTRKEKATRLQNLQDENRRSASAPIRSTKDNSMDITGYTNLMATPAKGNEYGTLSKNGEVGGDSASVNIASTLATLNARLRALETENTVSRRRVRELEDEVEKARAEVELAKQDGGKRLRDVIGEKSALEDLVKSLRSHLARLTVEVESNKALISELRSASSPPRRNTTTLGPASSSVSNELVALRREIERLSAEVSRLGGIVEEGLETRKKARGERTMRMEREEMERLVRQVIEEENEDEHRVQQDMEKRKSRHEQNDTNPVEPSKLRQGLHAAASSSPTLAPPTVQPPTRIAESQQPQVEDEVDSPTPISKSISQQGSLIRGDFDPKQKKSKSARRANDITNNGGPSSPFPSIVGDDLEAEFFSPSASRKSKSKPTSIPAASAWDKEFTETQAEVRNQVASGNSQRPTSARTGLDGQELPPQTVLARVLRELEDDFAHYKMIYSELADQYKLLDPASMSSKRHVLAEHLKEVIDVLEQKADQIGDLYDLLEFSDKPLSSSQGDRITANKKQSVNDVLRMVKNSLGQDVFNRLEDDLKFNKGRRRKSGGIEI
ncbi:uncharacterized protein I206_100157 [Kwoniella pini CBS 10737]|uniref:Cep57 centrosome microtubule-binding domain-containing protein n=1 Tax=Kwoniella pini CBS 10737 TaxID=1296096 RepID=A0A1B9IEK6_9TREE|nr:uncharacterized protein I206_01171 [Kwoniella pini CBS 10737]OCF53864.1 hypothetical protein I206_01171 [Kwoniella pini CBS 10737]